MQYVDDDPVSPDVYVRENGIWMDLPTFSEVQIRILELIDFNVDCGEETDE